MKTKSPYSFFMAQARYSYDPKTETPMQGRQRCAKALACAERRAYEEDVSFDWQQDRDMDSSEWSDEKPAWSTWSCTARDAQGKPFASLCGIDFGRDGEPWGNPYKRVVEAELACEMPAEE